MPGYVYGGSEPHKPRQKPETKPAAPLRPFDPAYCGTMAGYRQHRQHKQPQCAACRRAHNDYELDRLRRNRAAKRN